VCGTGGRGASGKVIGETIHAKFDSVLFYRKTRQAAQLDATSLARDIVIRAGGIFADDPASTRSFSARIRIDAPGAHPS
jgi:uncharacterized protein (DUF779 family)